MENKFLYEVHPSRIIRIPGQPPLRHPKSMLLSKEEVMNYMDFGRVYRKPAKAIEAILVTGENLDSLHVEDSKIDFTGLTIVASEKKQEVIKEEKPVVDETVEDDTNEETVESEAEEMDEVEEVISEPISLQSVDERIMTIDDFLDNFNLDEK